MESSGIEDFDEENIWRYNATFGVMAREALRKAGYDRDTLKI